MQKEEYVRWFESIDYKDIPVVGGKNASLGEMIQSLTEQGIHVPGGFATTSNAFWAFINQNGLTEKIAVLMGRLNSKKASLAETGAEIRQLILRSTIPNEISTRIIDAYKELCRRNKIEETDVAVRSSATAEDLPEASFAGQHESFLNVRGEENLLRACIQCYASLFTDRAITYRNTLGIDHTEVALSIGIQKMVHARSAGVMFTLDTETGFPDAIIINGAWGLGENVVKGMVTPDQYTVYKSFLNNHHLHPVINKTIGAKEQKLVYASPASETVNVNTTEDERTTFTLTDKEVLKLARWGVLIEEHYGYPMDIEWVRDEADGKFYIVQARPETVQSRRTLSSLKTYQLKQKGRLITEGIAIGSAIAAGKVCLIKNVADIDQFVDGAVLVAETTDPDWVPIMKRAAGIITDRGGRTSHAAIVSRELGVPAVVGTGNATQLLKSDQAVTLSCAEEDSGLVYDGVLDYEEQELDLNNLPETRTQLMINIASPTAAMRWWQLPVKGVGLARMEYLINNVIKIHPMALVRYDKLEDQDAKNQIGLMTSGYEKKTDYFVDHLARGIATIAASQYPDKVIVRTSDFKTNEYARLIGGSAFEPDEENPMLGWRGASRYYSDAYREGFDLECKALKKAREEIGFTNIVVMIPFCRTVEEADRVLAVMEENGLQRGYGGLEVYVMAEIPSNVVMAEEFAERFDGFSIGSNDLTQLVLGIDRDSEKLAYLFDERNDAIKRTISDLIERAHRAGRPVGICGQGPSDHPDFASFLVEAGIDSISLLPDSVLNVLKHVAATEQRKGSSMMQDA